MSDIELDYDYLTQRALKRVVFDVLTITAELGKAPGDHHFYIEFATREDGVAIPDHLIAAYPERMTIVLQHQFEDLDVKDNQFSVSLWFKGKQAHLTIPYEAVTSFADPSVQFGMRFAIEHEGANAAIADNEAASLPRKKKPGKSSAGKPRAKPNAKSPAKEKTAAADAGDAAASADVVELDAFRKK